MKRILSILLILALLVCGCSNTAKQAEEVTPDTNVETAETADNAEETAEATDGKLVIEDVAGRVHEFEKTPETLICLGASSLRVVSYLNQTDKVVGVEDLETKNALTCCYRYVNFDKFKDLPVIGQGGSGGSTPFEEEIIKLAPEVIFATYPAEKAEELQSKLNIPVVCLKMQDDFTDPALLKSLEVVGATLGASDRATELIELINAATTDLNDRTKDFAGEKPTTYPGAVSFRGGHGLEGTFSGFAPLKAINAVSISDQADMIGGYDMDLEAIVAANPDYIFLTISNMPLVEDQFASRPEIFEALSAFQEGRVYSYLPYNFYATNMELAIADAYYLGTVLYPEAFADIDISAKTNELTKAFLGVELYDDFVKEGYEFKEIKLQ